MRISKTLCLFYLFLAGEYEKSIGKYEKGDPLCLFPLFEVLDVTKRHRDDDIPEIPMLEAIMRCARWHREWHIYLIPLPGGGKEEPPP